MHRTALTQMEAVIFIGVQGAGKTSFYRERLLATHLRISLDELRTRQREQVALRRCLQTQQSFVVDNTNPMVSDRTRYIGPARAAGFRVVAFWFESSLQDAMRRNNARQGKQKIPIPAIVATFRKLQRPQLQEGFDEIHLVTISPDGSFIVKPEFA